MFNVIALSFFLTAVPPADALNQNADFWVRQLKSDSVDLRIQALRKLAEIHQPTTLSKVADALTDLSPEVRFQAMRALTKMPNADSLAALNAHLNAETDPYLVSELRRSVKAVEDSIKTAQEKVEKAALKSSEREAQKVAPKAPRKEIKKNKK